jgi:hypothetical protein
VIAKQRTVFPVGCLQAKGLGSLSPGQGVLAAALGYNRIQKICSLKGCDNPIGELMIPEQVVPQRSFQESDRQ